MVHIFGAIYDGRVFERNEMCAISLQLWAIVCADARWTFVDDHDAFIDKRDNFQVAGLSVTMGSASCVE